MEFMNEAIVSTSAHGANMANNKGSPYQFVVGAVIALVILRLEVMRQAADMPARTSRRANEGSFMSSVKLLWSYAPELTGLVALTAFTVYRREHFTIDPELAEVWADIIRQWPILLAADTLLCLQSMLRVLVLLSNVIRTKTAPTPLSKETAVLFLGAALGRVALAKSSDAYRLDGFIGGDLPIACEAFSVLLLAILCRGVSKGAWAATGLTLAAAARIGYRNRLALSQNPVSPGSALLASNDVADGMFMAAQVAELLGAFAYLSRTVLWDAGCNGTGKGAVVLNISHFIMPLQQCFAAYYWCHTFEYQETLVGAGFPFVVLHIGSVAALGAFAGAAVLHFVECLENPVEEQATELSAGTTAESTAAVPRLAPVPAVM